MTKPSESFSKTLWQNLDTHTGNVVVSPTSIETCLAFLTEALAPESKAVVFKTLGVPGNSAAQYILDQGTKSKELQASKEVTISNAAFIGAPFTASYVKKVHQTFGASVERLQPGAAGTHQVNSWVNEHTAHRIPKLVSSLDDAVAVWVNALTFDGKWETPFDAKLTSNHSFATPSGSRQVPMLAKVIQHGAYGEGKGYRYVSLPYKGDYRMVVLLPTSGDPASILTRSDLPLNVSDGIRCKIDFQMPKYTTRAEPKVESALMKMGLSPLFHHADFSPSIPSKAIQRIDQIIHKTYIKVNEEGTEAAAVTGIVTKTAIMRPVQEQIFHVDRPFAFFIQHIKTGELLFEGVIRDPLAE